MIKISPSVLSADLSKLHTECEHIQQDGADYIHLDVMDGNFVPNITFGAPVIKCARSAANITFDVHLMIDDPIRYIKDFAEAGSDIVTVHYEACHDVMATLDLIHSYGKKAGLSVKPATPVDRIYPFLEKIDMALIMTVEPGFGGQGLIKATLPKIKALKCEIEKRGLKIPIEVDGGIKADNIAEVAEYGAEIFVAGSSVFGQSDRAKAISDLRMAIVNDQLKKKKKSRR